MNTGLEHFPLLFLHLALSSGGSPPSASQKRAWHQKRFAKWPVFSVLIYHLVWKKLEVSLRSQFGTLWEQFWVDEVRRAAGRHSDTCRFPGHAAISEREKRKHRGLEQVSWLNVERN